ncbi:unnamed protein product [Paramecium sonneborni]|uniref:Uncharacterized protein n=1 Tax=Paramecium sonneborni TaxID=65129 RepID=A0A8S1RLV4_9CILI|nr:unnamed protein product [Paramecium sonneborni]
MSSMHGKFRITNPINEFQESMRKLDKSAQNQKSKKEFDESFLYAQHQITSITFKNTSSTKIQCCSKFNNNWITYLEMQISGSNKISMGQSKIVYSSFLNQKNQLLKQNLIYSIRNLQLINYLDQLFFEQKDHQQMRFIQIILRNLEM